MKIDTRVILTRRLLKEGLIRCIAEKPISKITVSDLCRQSGINRTTFYNHYESPAMILRDIAWDYAEELRSIYETAKKENRSGEEAIEACLTYLLERKDEIKIILSGNAENLITGFGLEIVSRRLSEEKEHLQDNYDNIHDDLYLFSVIISSAAYGLINVWITQDLDKSPADIVAMLKHYFGENIFF